MPRRRIPTLALALALAACASPTSAPQTCEADADCPAGARCAGRSCVANAPPVPAIAVPPAPEAWALLAFDGSASADPDAGDSIVAWAWAFRSLGAACPPPVVAGGLPVAQVRFGCPGRYAVDLTVTDELARSATATVELDVAAAAASPVLASDDLALDHSCTSLPTRCAPEGAIELSASAPDFGEDDLAFSWTVEPPPGRPLGANRRVTFSPSAAVASPTVSIETDGQAISGDWIFRVEARDAAGVVGAAVTRVSVLNRAPVVEKTIPIPDHAFAEGALTAAGEIPFTISDPDGDALYGPTIAWRHAGDGAGTFTGQLLSSPSRLAFAVSVPYAAREDALHLIGGEGLERSIEFSVTDENGAVTSEVWPIVVGNRPPVLVSQPAAFAVHHSYDPVAIAYVASAAVSTWSDPDGDPLFPAGDTGDPRCAVVTVADGTGPREAVAHCSLPYTGTPAVANLAGEHVVVVNVQDPWTPSAEPSTARFTIENRPPVVTSVAEYKAPPACTIAGGCCSANPLECIRWYYDIAAATALVPSRWDDPDGDPLQIGAPPLTFVSARPLTCVPPDCALTLDLARHEYVCAGDEGQLSMTVSDGDSVVTHPLVVARRCDG